MIAGEPAPCNKSVEFWTNYMCKLEMQKPVDALAYTRARPKSQWFATIRSSVNTLCWSTHTLPVYVCFRFYFFLLGYWKIYDGSCLKKCRIHPQLCSPSNLNWGFSHLRQEIGLLAYTTRWRRAPYTGALIHYQMEASPQLDMVVEPSTHSHNTLTWNMMEAIFLTCFL